MKKIISLLAIVLAAFRISAQMPPIPGGGSDNPSHITVIMDGGIKAGAAFPLSYADGRKMTAGEKLVAVFYTPGPNPPPTFNPETIPFAFSANGTLSLTPDGNFSGAFARVMGTIAMKEGFLDRILEESGVYRGILPLDTSAIPAGNYALYLAALDTRGYGDAPTGDLTCIRQYSAVYCPTEPIQILGNGLPWLGSAEIAFGSSAITTLPAYASATVTPLPSAWKTVPRPTSIEGVDVSTDAAFAAAMTPAVAAADGSPAFTLPGLSHGYLRYTVEATPALGQPWRPLDELLKNDTPEYTNLSVPAEGLILRLPKPGLPSCFYRAVGN